jgi:hypothetical protein
MSTKASSERAGASPGATASRDARRCAAAVLEVLAGARSPTEAAGALGLSLPRYYQVEARALAGLVAACEARPHGRQPSPDKEVQALRRDNQRLQREAARQQALVRAAQRTVGLAPPAQAPGGKGKKPRRRRLARGLSVAARLAAADHDAPAAAPAGPAAAAE